MKCWAFIKSGTVVSLLLALTSSLSAFLVQPAAAQSFPINPAIPTSVEEEGAETQGEGLEDVGRTADIGIGEVGQRTRVIINTDPMGRLNTRIQNRVQNRIRSRIDRDYDPTANATSPFEQADEQRREPRPNS